ncbi:hypothetical protein GRJ2_000655300 [Grus japonensis]|uniref:Uncharacterized protein n=1 Tax=Grus japonensis TaxID=30415 RepID=A0ABC9W8M1_GRUJA
MIAELPLTPIFVQAAILPQTEMMSGMFPHPSLKIPPKKRRRFTKSFGPLSHGKISDQVYNYPEGLGEVLYREQFDFNAEPPWEPS